MRGVEGDEGTREAEEGDPGTAVGEALPPRSSPGTAEAEGGKGANDGEGHVPRALAAEAAAAAPPPPPPGEAVPVAAAGENGVDGAGSGEGAGSECTPEDSAADGEGVPYSGSSRPRASGVPGDASPKSTDTACCPSHDSWLDRSLASSGGSISPGSGPEPDAP